MAAVVHFLRVDGYMRPRCFSTSHGDLGVALSACPTVVFGGTVVPCGTVAGLPSLVAVGVGLDAQVGEDPYVVHDEDGERLPPPTT